MATIPPFTPRARAGADGSQSSFAPPSATHRRDKQVIKMSMMSRSGLGSRPVCRYGDRCFRTNPQHFQDFAHPSLPSNARPPPAQSSAAGALSFRPVERPRRCKFGCGQPANVDSRRVYDTCCRACGMCQGSGDHDDQCAGGARTTQLSSGGHVDSSLEDAEAVIIMTVDHAMELFRRAKSYELQNDTARAQALFADSAEQLERARAKMPEGSNLAPLLDSVLAIWRRADCAGEPLGSLEETVDAELDRVVGELERALGAVLHSARFQGSSNLVMPPDGSVSDTAPNTLAMSQELALVTSEEGSESFDAHVFRREQGHDKQDTPLSPRSAGSHPAQAALRVLRLDDEWPTDLTRGEIRRRYMREALLSHPDKGPPEEKSWRTSRFQELSDAYSTLEVYISVLERMRSGTGGIAEEASDGFAGCGAGPSVPADGSYAATLLTAPDAVPALEGGQLAFPGVVSSSFDDIRPPPLPFDDIRPPPLPSMPPLSFSPS
eukprot:TRINITY_DN6010_c0_g1_i1.p1 TRINITY_DN6010_c0_g1~~TRINITY_DN6010_c0_g1_i1.p1  ORF type:complete len:493 (-),score=61.42 TRINITY_DN6010_c0_g1_i1:269-1747(-)